MKNKVDVLIIGGGLVGAVAALAIAGTGAILGTFVNARATRS